jgi:hypothetical protein
MTKLPRRRIEPLDPVPDSFDRVLTSARRRRRRKALVVASSTLTIVLVAAGSFALGSSLNVTQRVEQAADHNGNTKKADGSESGPTAVPSPTRSSNRKVTSTPGSVKPATPATIIWLHGRVVDPLGNGLPGIYVQPGNPNHGTFIPGAARGTQTGLRGEYAIPCPRSPVLLSTWQLNSNLQAQATGGRWAATFVEGTATKPVVPSCGQRLHLTRMNVGAELHGTVHVTQNCAPGTTFPVWLSLNGDRTESVRLVGLRDGDTFSFDGLPEGTHLFRAPGVRLSLTFAVGAPQAQDALVTCAGGTTPGTPTESGSPSASPTPAVTTPTPTETPTPTPSPSPTVS